MKQFLRLLGFLFMGSWTIAFGFSDCAVSSELSSTHDAMAFCDEMKEDDEQVNGTCSTSIESEEYFQSLRDSCEAGDFLYGDSYEASCALKGTGLFLGKAVEYDGDTDTLQLTWVLDPLMLDVTQDVAVSFRYRSKDTRTANLWNGDDSFVAVRFEASGNNASNTWCTTGKYNIVPARVGGRQWAIVLSAVGFGDEIFVEGAFVAFNSSQSEKTQDFFLQNTCSDGTTLGECDPMNSPEICSCISDLKKEKSFLLIAIPIALFPIGLCLACSAAQKKKCCKHEISCDNSSSSKPRGACEEKPQDVNAFMKHVQLSDLLAESISREHFRSYLERNFAPESLLFYENIETFQTCNDDAWRQEEAKTMLERFVAPDAPFKVPLSQSTQQTLCTPIPCFSKTFFDEAKAETYAYMQINFLEHFLDYRCKQTLTPRRRFSDDNSTDERFPTSDSAPVVLEFDTLQRV